MSSTSVIKLPTIMHNNCQVGIRQIRIRVMTETGDEVRRRFPITDFIGDEGLKAAALYDYVNDLHEEAQLTGGMSEIFPIEFILYQQKPPFRIIRRLESLKWIDIMYPIPRSAYVPLYLARAYISLPSPSPVESGDMYAYEMSHQHMQSTHEAVLAVASDETLPLPSVVVDICLQYINIPPTGRQLVFYNRFLFSVDGA
jgi:hypothetical protein